MKIMTDPTAMKAASERRYVVAAIPTLGNVRFRSLLAGEQADLHGKDPRQILAAMIRCSVCDEDGNAIYHADHDGMILECDARVTDAMRDVIETHCLNTESVDHMVRMASKNSSETDSDNSPTS